MALDEEVNPSRLLFMCVSGALMSWKFLYISGGIMHNNGGLTKKFYGGLTWPVLL